jgi:hypothetical protein
VFGVALPTLFSAQSGVPLLWRHCFLFLSSDESLETVGMKAMERDLESFFVRSLGFFGKVVNELILYFGFATFS